MPEVNITPESREQLEARIGRQAIAAEYLNRECIRLVNSYSDLLNLVRDIKAGKVNLSLLELQPDAWILHPEPVLDHQNGDGPRLLTPELPPDLSLPAKPGADGVIRFGLGDDVL